MEQAEVASQPRERKEGCGIYGGDGSLRWSIIGSLSENGILLGEAKKDRDS